MSKERDLLGRWHNGDLLPEEYMALMKETKELLAQPEQEEAPVGAIACPTARRIAVRRIPAPHRDRRRR